VIGNITVLMELMSSSVMHLLLAPSDVCGLKFPVQTGLVLMLVGSVITPMTVLMEVMNEIVSTSVKKTNLNVKTAHALTYQRDVIITITALMDLMNSTVQYLLHHHRQSATIYLSLHVRTNLALILC